MNQGDIIAVRGEGPNQVTLIFEGTYNEIDYGVCVLPNGTHTRPAPIDSITAKGYWRSPA